MTTGSPRGSSRSRDSQAWVIGAAALRRGSLAVALVLAGTGVARAQEAAAPPAAATGKFVPQPALNETETFELLEVVAIRAEAELGYRTGDPGAIEPGRTSPTGIRGLHVLVREDAAGARLLEMGFRAFRSQPVHLWLFGQAAVPGQPAGPNPDVAQLEKFLEEAVAAHGERMKTIRVVDLATERIKLSYCNPERCTAMLKMFEYTVVDPGGAIDRAKLPVVVPMAGSAQHMLVGGPDASFTPTESDPIWELLVFYDAARPEQLAELIDKVRNVIDVAARRLVIEGMVLEISQVGLERLGVEWELESPSHRLNALTIGRLPSFATQANDEVRTLDVDMRNVFGEFNVKIQALIREGHAEVLLRPNVTTIDNRMARINVGRIIPVVTSIANPKAEIVTVNFKDVKTGITLNVQPRVDADGRQISMQVVATVRARVPNEDVVITDANGNEVARSPTISEREVKTYTRIPDNTPFIIGGLISRDAIVDQDKVPILGDIPFIGPLVFSMKRDDSLKREVIIVITPRLLPEDTVISAAVPEDKDPFDTSDNDLFRDAYRIRAEDVFDLSFLYENRQLRRMQRLADQVIRRNPELGRQYPIRQFANGRLPGEHVLVYRQIYEVIKRRKIDDRIPADRILLFVPDEGNPAGFSITFLWKYLAKNLGLSDYGSEPPAGKIRERLAGRALAITYTIRRYVPDASEIMDQPVPEITFVECPDASVYSRKLWELNQPDELGRDRYTILLHNDKDLTRLRRALVLKRTVELNASRGMLTLSNFRIGRLLLMPTIKADQGFLIDEETAKYFFLVEQYYPALRQAMTRDLEAIRNTLQLPEYRRYLDNPDEVLRPTVAEPLE